MSSAFPCFVGRLLSLQGYMNAVALPQDADGSELTARAVNVSTPTIYRILQSDPALELRDYTPTRNSPPTDPGVLFQGLLSLSSVICGEHSSEVRIFERRTWFATNTGLSFFISPERSGSDSKLNYSIACQIVRGVGEYLAQSDILYTLLLEIWSQGDVIAIAGRFPVPQGAGESQNGSAVDVA